jgi:putative transcriptional regulator
MPFVKTRLRVLRAEREWSQAKLAFEVGVTRQTINCIEKGRFEPNLRLASMISS